MKQIGMLIYPGAQLLDITGPLEVFSIANRELQEQHRAPNDVYQLTLIADRAGQVRTSSGVQLVADCGLSEFSQTESSKKIDTLMLSGGSDASIHEQQQNPQLTEWLQQQAKKVRRLASICNGALLLASAGLLTGRRATTHWMDLAALRGHANITVEDDAIYVRDGNVYTSAGITSGIDLALALVEQDFGRDLSLAIARRMVLYLKRDGGQKQYSGLLASQRASENFMPVINWIYTQLQRDLSTEKLAEFAAMSPRNFIRRFIKETSTTPAKFIERARVEKGCTLLTSNNVNMDKIFRECGFQSSEQMRRAFNRQLGVSPSEYRKRFS